MPGVKSLQAQEYYAHPQNSFWKIIQSIYDEPACVTYQDKLSVLNKHKLAVWDVLQCCERKGSLDSNIKPQNAVANNLIEFLTEHEFINKIYFNGQTAHNFFSKKIYKNKQSFFSNYSLTVLPSTSPAHASMKYEEKLGLWKQHLTER